MAPLSPDRLPTLGIALFSLLLAVPAVAQTANDPAAAVTAFHDALARADSAAALALLAPDAVILESGDLETRAEYRAHHLPADIAFTRAVPSTGESSTVVLAGDVAWVTSTSRSTGTFQGRPVNSQNAELIVLSRDSAGWRIRAIHWSSRSRRQGG